MTRSFHRDPSPYVDARLNSTAWHWYVLKHGRHSDASDQSVSYKKSTKKLENFHSLECEREKEHPPPPATILPRTYPEKIKRFWYLAVFKLTILL